MCGALKEVSFNLSVLYVEDDPSTSQQFTTFLNKFFKNVVLAQNGKDGYSKYCNGSFDLVITDINMPIMNGMELIDILRKKNETQPIIASSRQYQNTWMLLKLINQGIYGFIKKPMDFDEATKILIRVCGLIQDRLVLGFYLEQLEKMQQLPTNSACSSQKTEAIDDDFFYFDSPQAIRHETNEDATIYKDYFPQLSAEDKEELADILGDIDSLLLGGGMLSDLPRLGSFMQRYGSILLHYQFFSDMGGMIVEMGSVISSDNSSIAHKPEDAKGLIGGFCTVLQNFMKEVWEAEASNPKFFNDSIVNDARTIIDILTPSSLSANNDGLVFF